MLPGYTAPKILWLKQNEPKNYKALETVLLPHDYLNFYLTGDRGMEYGDASGTGLLDVREKKWCEPLIEFIDPRSARRAAAAGQFAARVRAAARKPARGVGPLERRSDRQRRRRRQHDGRDRHRQRAARRRHREPRHLAAPFTPLPTEPVIDPQGEVAAFCDSTDRWLPLVCTMNVTVATEQVRKMFGWTHEAARSSTSPTRPPAPTACSFSLPQWRADAESARTAPASCTA